MLFQKIANYASLETLFKQFLIIVGQKNELQQCSFKSFLKINRNEKTLWEFFYVQFQIYARFTYKDFSQGKNQRSQANFF